MRIKKLRSALPRCLLSALLMGGIATTATVRAVDGPQLGLFELEGNFTDEAAPGTDWDVLHSDVTPTNMITFTGVLPDPAPQTIFWKGGSKDVNDVSEWWYKEGSVSDKSNITNAYAAAFTAPADVCINPVTNAVVACGGGAQVLHHANDMIVYFGMDRFANSGDTFGGFWFLQDPAAGIGTASSGQFTGNHVKATVDKAGDVLVLVEYPQASGAKPEIKVYEWDPDQVRGPNIAPNLSLRYSSSQAECDSNGAKLACAKVNLQTLPNPPWDYMPKGGNASSDMPTQTFFEGGINLTGILGVTPCISSFLAETRSSRSETASLEDFAFGNFDACGASVSKSCEANINQNGDKVTVDFFGIASNIGGLPLHVELQDDQPGSEITAVCFDANINDKCDPGEVTPGGLLLGAIASFTLGAGESVLYQGSYEVTQFNEQTEFTDEVTLTFYDDPQGEPIGSVSNTATCPPQGNADIFVFKDCIDVDFVDGTTFVAKIHGYVENTGNVKLVNVSVSDNVISAANLTVVLDSNGNGQVDPGEPNFANGGSLAAGAKLAFAANISKTDSAEHANEVTASGTNFFDSTDSVSEKATASCSFALNPDISVTKVCNEEIGGGTGVELVVDGGKVVVQVGNIITVTNTGNEVLKLVEIQDDQVQSLVKIEGGANLTCSAKSGATPAKCTGSLGLGEVVKFAQTYKPDGSAITGSLLTPGNVAFNNTATVKGFGFVSNGEVSDTDSASCELCPPHN